MLYCVLEDFHENLFPQVRTPANLSLAGGGEPGTDKLDLSGETGVDF